MEAVRVHTQAQRDTHRLTLRLLARGVERRIILIGKRNAGATLAPLSRIFVLGLFR